MWCKNIDTFTSQCVTVTKAPDILPGIARESDRLAHVHATFLSPYVLLESVKRGRKDITSKANQKRIPRQVTLRVFI